MDLATARDLSILFLAIVGIILAAIPLVLFYYLNRGLRNGRRWLQKTGLPQAQRYTRLMADKTNAYSVKIAQPVVKIDAKAAQTQTAMRAALTQLRNRRPQRSNHV